MPANNEIFISYAHTDNENPIGAGWVEQFHKTLKLRIKQILGARQPDDMPDIWRDKELQGNDELSDILVDKINHVDLLVSILSPSYINSDSCLKELNTFSAIAAQNGGLTVDNKARIFKVIKTPVELEQQPAPVRGQLGYPFFYFDEDEEITREYTLMPGDKHTAQALQEINDLAHNIIKTLRTWREHKPGAAVGRNVNNEPSPLKPAANEPASTTAKTIYLAETSYDLDDHYKAMRRELESRGHRVLPEGELPIRNPDHFNEHVNNALNQADLAIHMIGANRSACVAGGSQDIVERQNTLASEHLTLKRIIWLPSHQTVTDEAQQAFIHQLQFDPDVQKNADVLRQSLQDLMTSAHDTLARKPDITPTVKHHDNRTVIYVAYAQEDYDYAQPLITALFKDGYDVLEPLFDSGISDEQFLELHKRNACNCDALILYHNAAGIFWLHTQNSDFQRLETERQDRPLKAKAIFLGPNSAARQHPLRTHNLVIDGSNAFTASQLSPFLSLLTETPK